MEFSLPFGRGDTTLFRRESGLVPRAVAISLEVCILEESIIYPWPYGSIGSGGRFDGGK